MNRARARSPAQIPKIYTHYAAAVLFFGFGLKTLYDVAFKTESVWASFPT